VVVAVDGVAVQGKKVTSAMSETAAGFKLTVVRYKSETQAKVQAGETAEAVVDMEGFLYQVKAKDGRAVRLPKKKWVVLQGTTLTWYTSNKGQQSDVGTQSLANAACTLPLRSTNNSMTPAMRAFAELRKFPFMISWPNKELDVEFVFAASTSAERAAWANALKEAIGRAKVGAPTAGWLFKEGGRMSGFSLSGWKKRWFVMTPETADSPAALKYFENPASKKSKGEIMLRGSDAFIPKKLRGTGNYTHCFCITSSSQEEGGKSGSQVTTCTLLAASTAEDLERWMASLSDAIKNAASAAPSSAAKPAASKTKSGKNVGRDAGANAVQAGASLNIEQLKMLDLDALSTLRIKQLKAVLESMGVDYEIAVEKKDLVALIVKNR